MDIVGERKFLDVPGGKKHELPPLFVPSGPEVKNLDRMMDVAADIVDQEDMVPPVAADRIAPEQMVERRKLDLALNLVDQYLGLLNHWQWGDAVLEWIRQCEITFGERIELRNLLRSDLWPHAGRSSFVVLLEDKAIPTDGIQLEKAVGLRLAFRRMPPIRCCSDQFLFYLNNTVAESAYRTWHSMTPNPIAALPPERFEFEVVNFSVEAH
jgi:hypothetical protein